MKRDACIGNDTFSSIWINWQIDSTKYTIFLLELKKKIFYDLPIFQNKYIPWYLGFLINLLFIRVTVY